ncbi:hypothetical protein [Chondromyces crocatus]|uniref:Uncharacterized protein n=1 Tax=Chondromyces crocatus TaxID=52 RepID=A0A0K1EQK6_CHOCO|nr:hypothetical protein [Chondromyces crocatus]AKT42937.1 uncharacterized protein CMC5_071650 [Chondromyces crocatus]
MAIETELIRTVCKATFEDRATQPRAERDCLELDVPGVQLRAKVTPDMRLDLEVSATEWSNVQERALYDALDRSNSVVAGLLLWEWAEVRRTCAAAARRSA